MKRYEFRVTLSGEGDDEMDAWLDAVESFSSSPGLPPDDYDVFDADEFAYDSIDPLELGDSRNGIFEGC